jgi:hypothetical protein
VELGPAASRAGVQWLLGDALCPSPPLLSHFQPYARTMTTATTATQHFKVTRLSDCRISLALTSPFHRGVTPGHRAQGATHISFRLLHISCSFLSPFPTQHPRALLRKVTVWGRRPGDQEVGVHSCLPLARVFWAQDTPCLLALKLLCRVSSAWFPK